MEIQYGVTETEEEKREREIEEAEQKDAELRKTYGDVLRRMKSGG